MFVSMAQEELEFINADYLCRLPALSAFFIGVHIKWRLWIYLIQQSGLFFFLSFRTILVTIANILGGRGDP